MGMDERQAKNRAIRRWTALLAAAAVGWASAPLPVVAGGATSRFAADAQGVRDPDRGGEFLARAGLEAVGDEDWVDLTLEELAEKLRKTLRCRVEVDRAALRKHGCKTPETGFTIPFRGAVLRDALEQGLGDKNVRCAVDRNVLRITSVEAAVLLEQKQRVRYDVSDLAPNAAAGEKLDDLLSTVFYAHGPTRMHCPGFATEVDDSGRSTLSVSGTERQQEEVARILAELRAAVAETRGRPTRKLLPPLRRPGK